MAARSISVTFTGLDRLVENFKQSPEIVTTEVTKALHQSLAAVEMEVKKRTPVDTGYLQGSIGGAGGYTFIHGLSAGIGTNVVYSLAQEMGDGFRHPKGGEAHYTEHGAQAAVPFIEQEFEKAMEGIAKQLTK